MKTKTIILTALTVIGIVLAMFGIHLFVDKEDAMSHYFAQQRQLKEMQQQQPPLTGPGSDPCNSHPCDNQGRVTGPAFSS